METSRKSLLSFFKFGGLDNHDITERAISISFFFIIFLKSDNLIIMGKKEMDRHLSRNGATRDIKKDGAGGKFTWGKPGDEYMEDGAPLDKNDPSYVSPKDEE